MAMRMTFYARALRRLGAFLLCLGLLHVGSAQALWVRDVPPDGYNPDWPTYKVGILTICPPVSFMDRVDGKTVFRGYLIDLWREVGKLVHANMEFVPVEPQTISTLYSEGELDAGYALEKGRLIRDEVYFPIGITLYSRFYANKATINSIHEGHLQGLRCVSVVPVSNILPNLTSQVGSNLLQTLPVVYAHSAREALEMLDRGLVDLYFTVSELTADHLIQTYDLDQVVKVGDIIDERSWGIAVYPNRPEFVDQVRSALAKLGSTGERARLYDKWFALNEGKVLYRYRTALVAVAAGILSILALILAWNGTLRRRVARVTRDLRQAEQHSRELIESSPDMIFLVDGQGVILRANERTNMSLSLPERQGASVLADLVLPEQRAALHLFLRAVFRVGCARHEFTLRVAQVSLEVEIAGCMIQSAEHERHLACLFARDVTERKRLEEELIQAERLATIGKMATSVAHEVNNPLGIILTNADVLQHCNSEDPEELKSELVEIIKRNAVRAGEITTGLLEAASPKPLTAEVLDVEKLVHDSIALLGGKARGRRFTVQVLEGPFFIRGDSRILQQVLMNLFLNAISAMAEDEGHGEIKVTAQGGALPDSDALDTIRIVIRDTGKGIARKDLARIFEPFVSSREGGFGLGLFITRRMMERHSGLIFAESEVGKGTCLYLELPAHSQFTR